MQSESETVAKYIGVSFNVSINWWQFIFLLIKNAIEFHKRALYVCVIEKDDAGQWQRNLSCFDTCDMSLLERKMPEKSNNNNKHMWVVQSLTGWDFHV